ncbi:MAG TPA: NosD domain-containing protein [Candidatus Nanoarchaeia archaeon]|nr:NosD domain-containing protein [Candidatus Nanoarchaeia archaeon]
MRSLFILVGIFLGFFLAFTSVSAAECRSTPTDHCTISQSITFTLGSYRVENITLIGNNVDVDCNGATFEHIDGILFNVGGTTGATIHNCQASGYGRVIANYDESTLRAVPVETLTVRDNIFSGLPSIAIDLNNQITYANNYSINNPYPNVQIINNSITGAGAGVYITSINNSIITDNIFDINGAPTYDAIYVLGSSNVVIERNGLDHGKITAVHLGSGAIRAENMSISYNTISNVYRGIELNEGTDNTFIDNNYFDNNILGVYIKSHGNNITANSFTGRDSILDGGSSGIYIEQTPDNPQNNSIFLNVFDNLSSPAYDGGINNNWHAHVDDGRFSRDMGNFYQNYHTETQTVRGNVCTDINTDNICDLPYLFDEIADDPSPLRSRFLRGSQNSVFGQPPVVEPISDIIIQEAQQAHVIIGASSPLELNLRYSIRNLQGGEDRRFVPVVGKPNEFIWETGLFDAGNYTFLAVAIDERDMNTGELFKISISQSPQGCQHYLPRLVDGCAVETSITLQPNTYSLPHGIAFTADNLHLDCNGAVLEDATQSNSAPGMTLFNRHNITISNCFLQSFNKGIFIQNSRNIRILNSHFSNNYEDGVRALTSQQLLLQDNTFFRNQFAIHFETTDDSTIVHNFLEENENKQIAIISSSRNNVTENTVLNPIASGPIGVGAALAQDNIIYHNNFINYPSRSTDIGINTLWAINNEGNYWSTHACIDNNWDGRCENPYTNIQLSRQDPSPFARPDGWKTSYPQFTISDTTPDVGTPVTFQITDPLMAGKPYLVVLDLATTPNLLLGDGRTLDLVGTGLFFSSLVDPYSFGLVYSGSFDANGFATITWNIPYIPELHEWPFYLNIVPFDTSLLFPQTILTTYRSAGVVLK